MIRLIAGINGSGKSLYSSFLLAREAKRIYTNLRLTPAHPAFSRAVLIGTPEMPILCERCGYGVWDYVKDNSHVLIDEADLFFDAFCYERLRKSGAWLWFKQHRHHGLDVTLVPQAVETLYNRLRLLAGECVVCERETAETMRASADWLYWFWPKKWYPWRRTVCLMRAGALGQRLRCETLFPRDAAKEFRRYDTLHDQLTLDGCAHCAAKLMARKGIGVVNAARHLTQQNAKV